MYLHQYIIAEVLPYYFYFLLYIRVKYSVSCLKFPQSIKISVDSVRAFTHVCTQEADFRYATLFWPNCKEYVISGAWQKYVYNMWVRLQAFFLCFFLASIRSRLEYVIPIMAEPSQSWRLTVCGYLTQCHLHLHWTTCTSQSLYTFLVRALITEKSLVFLPAILCCIYLLQFWNVVNLLGHALSKSLAWL